MNTVSSAALRIKIVVVDFIPDKPLAVLHSYGGKERPSGGGGALYGPLLQA